MSEDFRCTTCSFFLDSIVVRLPDGTTYNAFYCKNCNKHYSYSKIMDRVVPKECKLPTYPISKITRAVKRLQKNGDVIVVKDDEDGGALSIVIIP